MRKVQKKALAALKFQRISANDLLVFSQGVVQAMTGNAHFPSPPIPLPAVTAMIGSLNSTLQTISAQGRSKALTNQKDHQSTELMEALTTLAHYAEDVSNKAASGDVTQAEGWILSAGFQLKKKGAKSARVLEFVKTKTGFVHVRAPRSYNREVHLWKYGLTSQKDVVPSSSKLLISLEADISISDLPSGSIIAVQHGSVVPSGRNAKFTKPDAAFTSHEKISVSIPTGIDKHPVFSHNTSDYYQWGGWIYIIVP